MVHLGYAMVCPLGQGCCPTHVSSGVLGRYCVYKRCFFGIVYFLRGRGGGGEHALARLQARDAEELI